VLPGTGRDAAFRLALNMADCLLVPPPLAAVARFQATMAWERAWVAQGAGGAAWRSAAAA
jgi:hypothetical protein